MSNYHVPVLLQETINSLDIQRDHWYVDGTLGGGGHSFEILNRGGKIIGIDTDIDAIDFVSKRLENERNIKLGALEKLNDQCSIRKSDSVMLVHGNFSFLESIVKSLRIDTVDGVLLDLGISSHQIDTPERGFSYRYTSAPLDLRMSKDLPVTAEQLIRDAGEGELYEIFTKYAEEKFSHRIARAIVRARAIKDIISMGDLVECIQSALPKDDIAVLSRIFQALRIVVNNELENLRVGLEGSYQVLKHGGNSSIISFHSLEDRIVKLEFRKNRWKQITKKPILPSDEERQLNQRSRSAKLRVAQKYA